ncbi:hypothetical protein ACJMK2_037645 [Sinanodonta woodiana]|uniref:non-specific serine/threonine protein kinase n=1 Tax=Sinanodonta woodiana TaxID=1069815 RepID=A0ABD3WL37_SINWO
MALESYKERQKDELQVLQAIFLEDFVDLRKKSAWKVDRPPEIRLSLKPHSDDGEVYTQIDMVVKCSSEYPEDPPEISLENPRGLSNRDVAALKTELTSEAIKLRGQEMILELCHHVQNFLFTHNKPPAKSFYEEMMSNKKKQEEEQERLDMKKVELLRRKQEKERRLIEDQIQKRQEAVYEEKRRRKEILQTLMTSELYVSDDESNGSAASTPSAESFLSHSPIGGSPNKKRERSSVSPSPAIIQATSDSPRPERGRQRRTSTPRDLDEEFHCKDHGRDTLVLTFSTKEKREVFRGTCVGHSDSGSTLYVGIEKKTGDPVIIAEWILKWRSPARKNSHNDDELDKEAQTYIKQIQSIEQELMSLVRLSHQNIIQYLAMKYDQEPGKIMLYLLMENPGGHCLGIYVKKKKPILIDVLRSYTEEILLGLEYLHNNGVVHKNLQASSVHVDTKGRIRIADYSIDKRIFDLHMSIEESKPGVKFSKRKPPTIGRGGKKADIYQLGLLLLSLAQGYETEEVIPVIPTTFPPAFFDFLKNCLLKDERLRWTTGQLMEHSFLKETIPVNLQPPGGIEGQLSTNRGGPISRKEEADEEDEALLFITAWEASGQSRLTGEFTVLRSLGKGGFGDVLKVKNKLDGRLYAIKRITLNPKSQVFNKKITREVKLLSRLNHENVVRYYNSWIETSDEPAQSDTSSSGLSESPKVSDPSKQHPRKNSLDLPDDIEQLVPQFGGASQDFSISYEPSGSHMETESEEEEDDEDMELFGLSLLNMHDDDDDGSDSIVFDESKEINENKKQSYNQPDTYDQLDALYDNGHGSGDKVPKLQYLYIQMEYCEKSTLRSCIDAGLYQDHDRVWRLFREIIEGLVHIHEQGVIHRDLKPVNIFLDFNDHVKIGDFGLATTDIIAKKTMLDVSGAADIHGNSSRSGSGGDGSMTGMVGTALYVSPEMSQGEKIIYHQKVDIYSLGIIFFEMCYKPLPTGMERVLVLSHLRTKDMIFPDDFDHVELENQSKIIRWLLNHDPSQRPSAVELLQSEYLPPPQMEEAELNEILRSTISDPHSKPYRRMINALFSQSISLADDHLYDSDIYKGIFSIKTNLVNRQVHESLERIFQRHGALKVITSILMPKPAVYRDTEQYVCMMDDSGQLLGLPHDLRVPFARYVARYNIHHMKRYCIERVFRKKNLGFHPRELTECAFDIITNTPGSLIPDGEVLALVEEVIRDFPPLQRRHYYVRINHTSLLKAALLHAGVNENQHLTVLGTLTALKNEGKEKAKMKIMSECSLNEQAVSSLLHLLETEGSLSKVSSMLRCITKTKGQVMVSVGWVYNIQQYSGVYYQVAVDVRKKNRAFPDVFAAGGRYNSLISGFYSPVFSSSKPVTTHYGVGVSFAFEKIVNAMLEEDDFPTPSPYDILVCTIGRKPLLKDRMKLVKELWNAGLRAEHLLETLESPEEIQDFCRTHGISYLVLLKESDVNTLKLIVKTIEKERVTEKLIRQNEKDQTLEKSLVDFFKQKLTSNKLDSFDTSQTGVSRGNTTTSTQPHVDYTPSISASSSGGNLTINFYFFMLEGKISPALRKKSEAQIVSKINSSLPWLSGKGVTVEAVAMEMTVKDIRIIAAFLDLDGDEDSFESSIGAIAEKLPRYRKYLSHITDHIYQLKFEKKCNCIVLYGMKDEGVKLLTSS